MYAVRHQVEVIGFIKVDVKKLFSKNCTHIVENQLSSSVRSCMVCRCPLLLHNVGDDRQL